MATLESKNYIATEADIASLARSIITGALQSEGGRKDYLKVLLASTLDALGAKPRIRQGKASKLDEASMLKHLELLEATHTRFYAIIVRETASVIPAGKEHANELNRRTTYARVAVSRLRTYVKAGGDMTVLAPARVTRDTIRVKAATPRAVSGNRLRQRAERESKTLMATLIGLAETDKATAVTEMQLLIGQIAQQLVQLGVASSTKDVEQAARDHIPLRVGRTLFIPTESQVIRAKEMPA